MNLNSNIEDALQALDRAKTHVPKDWDYLATDETVMEKVIEMEYFVKPLGDHLGVSKDLLPPLSDLEEDEIKILVEKIIDVWAIYNYHACLPKGLPIRKAYETLLSVWEEPVSCFPTGGFYFDFYDLDLDQYVTTTE